MKVENLEKIIKNNVVVICNESMKRHMLYYARVNKILIKCQFKSALDIITSVLGSYSKEALIKLCEEKGVIVDFGKALLEASLLVDDSPSSRKTAELMQIKSDYKKYLIKDELAYYELAHHDIFVVGRSLHLSDNNQFIKAINILSQLTNVSFVEVEEFISTNELLSTEVTEYKNVREEVFTTFESIASLLSSNVKPENIYIHNVDETYYSIVQEASFLYNIDVDLQLDNYLYYYPIAKDFLSFLADNCHLSFNEVVEELAKSSLMENDKGSYLAEIIAKYQDIDTPIKQLIDFLKDDLKTTKIKKTNYYNIVSVVDALTTQFKNDDHVFILGCNQGKFPLSYKDDDYLSDEEYTSLGLKTSLKKNIELKQKWNQLFKQITNLHLSYSVFSNDGEMYKSGFFDDPRYFVVYPTLENEGKTVVNSKAFSLLDYAKKWDRFKKFGEDSWLLRSYKTTFFDIEDRKYSFKNTFKNPDKIKSLLAGKLKLSHTAVKEYYECPFKYYANRVLRLNKNVESEAIELGNFLHYVLYSALDKDLNVDDAIASYYLENPHPITAKEKFYKEIIRPFIEKAVTVIKQFHENSNFKIAGLEKEYEIAYKVYNGIDVIILGKIDKLLTGVVDEDEYAVVIDYKTGSTDIDWGYLLDGLNMQIPFYFFFIRSEKDYKFGGGFLQSVIPNSYPNYSTGKTYQSMLNEEYKLNGYCSDEKRVLFNINKEFGEGKVINHILLTNHDDFHSNSKTRMFSDDEFAKVMEIFKVNLDRAIEQILSSSFDIVPIEESASLTCQHCDYKEMCYFDKKSYRPSNKVKIKEYVNKGEQDDSK